MGSDLGLPESVQEIAEVIGRDKALYLIGQLPTCGKRSWRVVLYVPKRIRADHQLVRLLGWHDAQAMVREFGGMILQPSNCNQVHRQFRNQEVRRLADSGLDNDAIAAAVGVSTRTVRRILRDKPPEVPAAANDNTVQNGASK